MDVLRDNSNHHVTTTTEDDLKKKIVKKASTPRKKPQPKTVHPSPAPQKADDSLIGTVCPKCGKGRLIKGKTAYGCSNWKSGCDFRIPFNNK
jgi:DNA topoisomerase-3